MEGKGGTHAGPFQGQPAICCFGNDAELTGKGRKRLGSQLIAMGMQADGASKYLLSLASKSSLSLEQQDAIDQAQLMCEKALKLLKTDNGRDEALKYALNGLKKTENVFGQMHLDVARSESQHLQ
jgi:hypothetical protein